MESSKVLYLPTHFCDKQRDGALIERHVRQIASTFKESFLCMHVEFIGYFGGSDSVKIINKYVVQDSGKPYALTDTDAFKLVTGQRCEHIVLSLRDAWSKGRASVFQCIEEVGAIEFLRLLWPDDRLNDFATFAEFREGVSPVEITFDDPTFDQYYPRFLYNLSLDLVGLLFKMGRGDFALEMYMHNLVRYIKYWSELDRVLSDRIAESYQSDSDKVHFIPRTAYRELTLSRHLDERSVPCLTLEGESGKERNPIYLFAREYLSRTNHQEFMESEEGHRLAIVSLLAYCLRRKFSHEELIGLPELHYDTGLRWLKEVEKYSSQRDGLSPAEISADFFQRHEYLHAEQQHS